MSLTGEALLAAALKLPEAERAALAEALFESIGGGPEDVPDAVDLHPDWDEELRRRLEDMRTGAAPGIPWEVLRDELAVCDLGSMWNSIGTPPL